MNHCITCGARVSRGRGYTTGQRTARCLICQVRESMAGWRFETGVMKLRKQAKEAAQDGRRDE